MSKAERRQVKRAEAAAFLDDHAGPVMSMLVDVISDLGPETAGMKQFEADAAYCSELAYRLDASLVLSDPLLEALDGIIIFFVALAAVGIWRSVAKREKLRSKRLVRLRERLEAQGPKMAKSARRRMERRVAKLASR
jgi:hypothetical protein